jgi:hypothetical protein
VPRPRRTSSDTKGNSFVAIAVAVIGALAVILGAAIANWDRIFPPPAPNASAPSLQLATAARQAPTPQQSTSGPQSPAISGVSGNVTINLGRPERNEALDSQQRATIDGDWQTDVFVNGGNAKRFVLQLKTLADGRIVGMVQHLDPASGSRIFSPFGVVDGRTDGSSFSMSFYGGFKSRDAAGQATIPVKETFYGEVNGDELQVHYQNSDMPPVGTVARRTTANPAAKTP